MDGDLSLQSHTLRSMVLHDEAYTSKEIGEGAVQVASTGSRTTLDS